MIVTEKTKYAEFVPLLPFIDDDQKQKLYKAAEAHFKPYNTLTFDEFFGILEGDYQLLGDLKEPTVLQAFWLENFEHFVQSFTTACEQMTLPPTPESTRYSAGCKPFEPKAAMLVFVREYFGLHSFTDCGKITLGEYITARQDKYNEQIMQRNQSRELERKYKKK